MGYFPLYHSDIIKFKKASQIIEMRNFQKNKKFDFRIFYGNANEEICGLMKIKEIMKTPVDCIKFYEIFHLIPKNILKFVRNIMKMMEHWLLLNHLIHLF